MELMPNGAPRFVAEAAAPAQTNCWDPQFTLPNGTNGNVHALVVNGSDVYVGGAVHHRRRHAGKQYSKVQHEHG
jgi:hypothetical protein